MSAGADSSVGIWDLEALPFSSGSDDKSQTTHTPLSHISRYDIQLLKSGETQKPKKTRLQAKITHNTKPQNLNNLHARNNTRNILPLRLPSLPDILLRQNSQTPLKRNAPPLRNISPRLPNLLPRHLTHLPTLISSLRNPTPRRAPDRPPLGLQHARLSRAFWRRVGCGLASEG